MFKKAKCGIWLLIFLLPLFSYGEVESVKVGGEISVRGIWWKNMDLQGKEYQVDQWLDSTVRLNISADLTENVGVFFSLINERDWNVEGDGTVNPENSSDVELDLAYLKLEKLWDSDFSVIIGRQELIYGEAFLLGANPEAPCPIHYPYGARVGFDAVKVNYSFTPWSVDFFKAKISEGYGKGDDENLYGINAHLSQKGEWDFAFLTKTQNPPEEGKNETYALSIRGEGEIPQFKGLSVKGEIVKEWGKIAKDAIDTGYPEKCVSRQALGGYLGINYTVDNPYSPYFGITYIYESGDKNADKKDGRIESFDPFYEDETFGIIADGGVSDYLDTSSNKIIWVSNFGFAPAEKVSLDLSYYSYRLAEAEYNSSGEKTSKDAGYEWDITLSYEYSEDVNFSFWYAYFHPGKYFEDIYGEDYEKNAEELGFSLTVSF